MDLNRDRPRGALDPLHAGLADARHLLELVVVRVQNVGDGPEAMLLQHPESHTPAGDLFE